MDESKDFNFAINSAKHVDFILLGQTQITHNSK